MRYKAPDNQRGLAVIELVLVTPLIIIFMALFLEVGSFFIDHQTLNKMVRNGARHAVTEVYGTVGGGIADTDEIKNLVVYGVRSGGTESLLDGVTVDDVTVVEAGSLITVSANYTYSPLYSTIPFLTQALSVTMSASAIMEKRDD
ncbi:pilus assembly protein [Vibrio wakamikoensis]|uniref:TadE family protein n=1 Tax=Vibrio chaetopteri TaxID=3016528 RepID=A0AAU8BEZ8_9VIBR